MKLAAKPEIHSHVLDIYDNQHLTPNHIYDAIGIDSCNYRIIDDAGEPILYPKYLFIIIDDSIPDHWTVREYEDGEYYIDPPELSSIGFYERYFDNDAESISVFKQFLVSFNS